MVLPLVRERAFGTVAEDGQSGWHKEDEVRIIRCDTEGEIGVLLGWMINDDGTTSWVWSQWDPNIRLFSPHCRRTTVENVTILNRYKELCDAIR